MIKSKDDLKYFLEQDRKALNKAYLKPKLFRDYIWRYEIYLRKAEYYNNCKKSFIGKAALKYYQIKISRTGRKNGGFNVPLNTTGPGLSIAHYGSVIINRNAVIGKNCRIHEGVTIGTTNGESEAPKLGDNVFIGTGAKIIGNISVGNCCTIGANTVVTHDFDDGAVIVGVPGRKIKEDFSKCNLSSLLNK